MPDVFFNGGVGRIEAKYHSGPYNNSPAVLILHPDPKSGGTMHNKVVYALHRAFSDLGFATLRFNFRGVGKSEGAHDNGEGELSDAAAALDWLQSNFKHTTQYWIAGFSFGSWIAMQLLMRRPEFAGFITISPPANKYDFNFLAPCPVSGQIIQGTDDTIVTQSSVDTLVNKLNKQKGVNIDYQIVEHADHFFTNQLSVVAKHAATYIRKRCPNLFD